MLPALAARTEPRWAAVRAALESKGRTEEACAGIFALHLQGGALFRATPLEIEGRWLPSPGDLPAIVNGVLAAAVRLFAPHRDMGVSALVSAFVIQCIIEVQPFARANAKIAIDLGHYLLLRRHPLTRLEPVFCASDAVAAAVDRIVQEGRRAQPDAGESRPFDLPGALLMLASAPGEQLLANPLLALILHALCVPSTKPTTKRDRS